MKNVQNISDQELAIPNVGSVAAGETVSVPDDFNNPNFVVVKSGQKSVAKEAAAEDSTNKK